MSCRRRSFMNPSCVCSFTGVKSKISNIKHHKGVFARVRYNFFPSSARDIFSPFTIISHKTRATQSSCPLGRPRRNQCSQQFSSSSSPPSASPSRFPNNARS